jgi:AraC family ethanolamine operon transcriptional activator
MGTLSHASISAPPRFRDVIPESGGIPLSTRVHTRDINEQAERLRHWDQTYVQLSGGKFEGRIIEGWFGSIQVFRETTTQVIHEQGRSRTGAQTFCLPVAMDGTARFRGVDWAPDACATLGGGLDFDLCTPGTLDVVAVSLPGDKLLAAADAQGFDAGALARSLSSSCLLPLAPHCGDTLRAMLIELTSLIETDAALLTNRMARLGIESAIYDTALQLITHSLPAKALPATHLPKRSVVYRAIEYVESRPTEMTSVSELCAALRMSRRTLQAYFGEVLHISPLQYLRARRLNKVRSSLRRGEGSLTVGQAAADWGFWHLSQFAADYRKLFGELPSETAEGAVRKAS